MTHVFRCDRGALGVSTEQMIRDSWNRHMALLESLEHVIPPVLVGVPGAFLGIEVPFMPRPGRLHIVVPYTCDEAVDLAAMQAMRGYCSMPAAA